MASFCAYASTTTNDIGDVLFESVDSMLQLMLDELSLTQYTIDIQAGQYVVKLPQLSCILLFDSLWTTSFPVPFVNPVLKLVLKAVAGLAGSNDATILMLTPLLSSPPLARRRQVQAPY